MAYVKDAFVPQLSVGTNSHTNALDVAGRTGVGSTIAGVVTVPANGLLTQGNVGIGVTSTSVPLHMGYNAGNDQIAMEASGGSLGTLQVGSSRYLNVVNRISNGGFKFITSPTSGTATKFELQADGTFLITPDDSDTSGGQALLYSSITTGNTRAILTKTGTDAGEFLLHNAGTATIDLKGSGVSYFNTGGNLVVGDTSANATLHVQGSRAVKITATSSASYSVQTDDYLIAADSTSNTVNVVLPTAASSNAGVVYVVKDAGGNAGTNNISVTVSGGGNIDNTATVTLGNAYGARTFYSNGTQWFSEANVVLFLTDSGEATPSSSGGMTIAGGTNMNTSGSGSTVTVNLDSAVLGLTDLTVDNLEVNGNTISTTNTNGDLILSPNGSGTVGMGGSTSPDVELVIGTVNITSNGLSPALNITGSSGSFGLNIGQSATALLSYYWTHNATEANASATLETAGHSNPITINASELQLNATSNEDVGVGTNSPNRQLYVEGSTTGWNLLVSAANSTVESGFYIDSAIGSFGTFTNHNFGFRANNSNVGLATPSATWTLGSASTPANTLDVDGNIALGSYAQSNTAPSNGLIVSGNVGIATNSPIATLDVQGSQALKITSVSMDYSILTTDYLIAVTDTSVARTITLPSPAAGNSGVVYVVKDASGAAATNNITVDSAAGNIDGTLGTTGVKIDTNYGSLSFYSNGSNWFII